MVKNIIFNSFLLIILASCATKVEKRGYMFDLVDHHLLQEGVTSKERVLKIMGFPTFISALDEETWIYYSEDKEGFLFFRPKITSRNILVLKFDDSSIINNIAKVSLADEAKDLHFAANHTIVESRKIGALKSIFNNVGQIKSQ